MAVQTAVTTQVHLHVCFTERIVINNTCYGSATNACDQAHDCETSINIKDVVRCLAGFSFDHHWVVHVPWFSRRSECLKQCRGPLHCFFMAWTVMFWPSLCRAQHYLSWEAVFGWSMPSCAKGQFARMILSSSVSSSLFPMWWGFCRSPRGRGSGGWWYLLVLWVIGLCWFWGLFFCVENTSC